MAEMIPQLPQGFANNVAQPNYAGQLMRFVQPSAPQQANPQSRTHPMQGLVPMASALMRMFGGPGYVPPGQNANAMAVPQELRAQPSFGGSTNPFPGGSATAIY